MYIHVSSVVFVDFLIKSSFQKNVTDQLVINCNDSRQSCLMLVVVRHEYSMLKLIFNKDIHPFGKKISVISGSTSRK